MGNNYPSHQLKNIHLYEKYCPLSEYHLSPEQTQHRAHEYQQDGYMTFIKKYDNKFLLHVSLPPVGNMGVHKIRCERDQMENFVGILIHQGYIVQSIAIHNDHDDQSGEYLIFVGIRAGQPGSYTWYNPPVYKTLNF